VVMPRFTAILCALLIVACASETPAAQLSGLWGGFNLEIRDSAQLHGTVVLRPCPKALFSAPIVLDSTGSFTVTGSIIETSWGGDIGWLVRMSGRVRDGAMTLQFFYSTADGGWDKPTSHFMQSNRRATWNIPGCLV
jgi:hypothetical protein